MYLLDGQTRFSGLLRPVLAALTVCGCCAWLTTSVAAGRVPANGVPKVDPHALYGGMQVSYVSTAADGIATYTMNAPDDGPGPQTLRVLKPTHPAAGVAHNFLYVLPVEPGLGTTYGDGMQVMSSLNAANRYNLTIVEPTFAIAPWYANIPNEPYEQYESFMTQELVPWVKAQLATTGHEHNQLLGFSKSGIGAQDLLLKHPKIFSSAASWDFPAAMTSYVEYGAATGYGNESNFQSGYRLTKAFVAKRRAPFEAKNRIWIGGYDVFGTDVDDYDSLLTAERIKHTMATPEQVPHRWERSWVQEALAAIR